MTPPSMPIAIDLSKLSCKLQNETCSVDRDCCARGVIGCVGGSCNCQPNGQTCTKEIDCCKFYCHGVSKTCTDPPPFKCRDALEGRTLKCEEDWQCCSKKCENGSCFCKLNGERCGHELECCSKLCDNGTCKRKCKASGESCNAFTTNPDCCEGACVRGKCTKCDPKGAPCSNDLEVEIIFNCCSQGCTGDGTCGRSRASRPSFPGDPCSVDSDCEGDSTKCDPINKICGLGSHVGGVCNKPYPDNACFPNGIEECSPITGRCELIKKNG